MKIIGHPGTGDYCCIGCGNELGMLGQVPAGCPQGRPGRAAQYLSVIGRVAVRRAAEPDREDQRGGQLTAAGDLGELIGFAGSAKRGERVGEGPAERFVNAVRAGCDARAVRGLRNPDDKDVSIGRACR